MQDGVVKMDAYVLPYSISDKMLEFVAEISEKGGRINSHTAFK